MGTALAVPHSVVAHMDRNLAAAGVPVDNTDRHLVGRCGEAVHRSSHGGRLAVRRMQPVEVDVHHSGPWVVDSRMENCAGRAQEPQVGHTQDHIQDEPCCGAPAAMAT